MAKVLRIKFHQSKFIYISQSCQKVLDAQVQYRATMKMNKSYVTELIKCWNAKRVICFEIGFCVWSKQYIRQESCNSNGVV